MWSCHTLEEPTIPLLGRLTHSSPTIALWRLRPSVHQPNNVPPVVHPNAYSHQTPIAGRFCLLSKQPLAAFALSITPCQIAMVFLFLNHTRNWGSSSGLSSNSTLSNYLTNLIFLLPYPVNFITWIIAKKTDQALRSPNVCRSFCPDGITTILLNINAQSLLRFRSLSPKIFTFPTSWKCVLISTAFKRGDPSDPNDHCLNSHIFATSNACETVICGQPHLLL